MKKRKIIVLCGSTKIDASNVKIIEKFAQLNEAIFDVRIYPIHKLPYFNPDLDNAESLPKIVTQFRKAIDTADGVLVCTPEYVFSLPGILKNALEWTVSTIVFNEKPTAIIIASSVGEKAFESLHLVMTTIGAKIGDKSAILIKSVKTKINTFGEFTNAETLHEFEELIEDFKKNINCQ